MLLSIWREELSLHGAGALARLMKADLNAAPERLDLDGGGHGDFGRSQDAGPKSCLWRQPPRFGLTSR